MSLNDKGVYNVYAQVCVYVGHLQLLFCELFDVILFIHFVLGAPVNTFVEDFCYVLLFT